jgi:hypothetical protein
MDAAEAAVQKRVRNTSTVSTATGDMGLVIGSFPLNSAITFGTHQAMHRETPMTTSFLPDFSVDHLLIPGSNKKAIDTFIRK